MGFINSAKVLSGIVSEGYDYEVRPGFLAASLHWDLSRDSSKHSAITLKDS